MGDFQRALYDFSVAIRIEKSRDMLDNKLLAEYYNMSGVQHFELAQYDDAKMHYELAIHNDKTNGQYYYNRGLVHSRLG